MNLRRWMRTGPSRAELIAEAELWRGRCERKNAEVNAAHVRAKTAEKRVREQARRMEELEDRISEILAMRLNEPERVDGCTKIRFIREQEADDFRKALSASSGEPLDAL